MSKVIYAPLEAGGYEWVNAVRDEDCEVFLQSVNHNAPYWLTNARGSENGDAPPASETYQFYEQRQICDEVGNLSELRHLLTNLLLVLVLT
jgi:hypothetical protein